MVTYGWAAIGCGRVRATAMGRGTGSTTATTGALSAATGVDGEARERLLRRTSKRLDDVLNCRPQTRTEPQPVLGL